MDDSTAKLISEAASTSPAVASALEDLALDALAAVRAMLEDGATEDRLAAIKTLLPLMKQLGERKGDGVDVDTAAEARSIIAGTWDGLK